MRLSDPRTPISVSQQGSQMFVDFSGTELPKALTRRYDTLDFGTPVVGFEAERVNGNDARIVLDASGDFDSARLPDGQPVRGRGITGAQGDRRGTARGAARNTRASA